MARIELTWTPADPATAISYEVRYALESATPSYLYVSTFNTYITINGLLEGETYVVGVRTLCEGNIWSEWTNKQLVVCDDIPDCFMEGYAEFTGTITFVKDGTQTITHSEMIITGPALIDVDWGDGTIETIPSDNFSHSVNDDAVVIIYGAVETFHMISTNKISNLTAAYHETLTSVTVTDNNLTEADFTNSAALTTLILNDNLFTTIAVEGCTALDWFRCYDNPTFTENINVSECTALRKYENYSCSQTAIDVTNLPLLYYLDCRTNNLTTIDLSGNPILRHLSIRINPPLTGIDISNNPLLEWIEFRSLYNVTSFDISNNPNLVYIQADYTSMTEASNNALLIQLDTFGESNGWVDIEHSNAITGAGLTARTNLIGKGWNVEVDL